MRLDLMLIVNFLDDDGVIRPARLIASREGRVMVMVTRGVGMTHVLGSSAERIVEGPVDIVGLRRA